MRKNKKIKVAVLMGGPSSEHDVSLKSGENVLEHLDENLYSAFPVIIGKNGEWPISLEKLKEKSDIVFIAMHGSYGEDGEIQSILESKKIPYTGSNSTTCALTMNKFVSSRLFKHHGFYIPISFHISKTDWEDKKQEKKIDSFKTILNYIKPPFVIKPNRGGSSVGIIIAKDEKEFDRGLDSLFSVSNDAIVQQFIKGREVTCVVLDHGWEKSAYPLLPTEIIPKKSSFFDYDSKYNIEATHEITPARLPASYLKLVQKTALNIHRLVKARGFSRTDMIIDPKGKIYVLEINTIPGLTKNSLLPKALEAGGIKFETFLDSVIKNSFNKN